jgi:hypothetical protein
MAMLDCKLQWANILTRTKVKEAKDAASVAADDGRSGKAKTTAAGGYTIRCSKGCWKIKSEQSLKKDSYFCDRVGCGAVILSSGRSSKSGQKRQMCPLKQAARRSAKSVQPFQAVSKEMATTLSHSFFKRQKRQETDSASDTTLEIELE